MIKLSTPYGTGYLLEPSDPLFQAVRFVGPAYKANRKYPDPMRPIMLATGQTAYVADTADNMRALVGDAYVPDKPFKKAKKAKSSTEATEE